MSIHQTNTSVTRSRSLRVPAKGALTAPETTILSKQTQVPSKTSNVALFLTNLRLLDLDYEPDWPEISPATFSTRDAAGGQKKRIQCVEWALYQLFLLWDHNEAQNKLRPFYPPLDQVQSINLRAALLRGLEQAKKNGVLGRDAVIRKTMLDECKGERFEEVLAVFSSAVLKKLVAERALNSGPEYRPTVSERLALESWGYSGDRTELNGLLLAYKASLAVLLAKKRAARAKYHDFEKLLALKEQGIIRRQEQARASSRHKTTETSDKTKAEVRKTIRANWTGNEQWVDGLMFNDTQLKKGGLLGTSFDQVWAGVKDGRISDLEDENAGLLEQLDNRVRLQKSRLEKWDDFRKKMFGNRPPKAAEDNTREKGPKGVDLGFTAHHKLSVDAKQGVDVPTAHSPPPEYARLLKRMEAKLDRIGKSKIPDFSTLLGSTRRRPGISSAQYLTRPEPIVEPMSDLSEWEDEQEEESRPPPKHDTSSTSSSNRRTTAQTRVTSPRRHIPKAHSAEESGKGRKYQLPNEAKSSKQLQRHQSISPTPLLEHQTEPKKVDDVVATYSLRVSPPRNLPPDSEPSPHKEDAMPPPPRPASPTQALADEILASMSNASPSPNKKTRHTLSLAERTRMSMTRTKSFDPDDETTELSPVKSSPIKANGDISMEETLEQGEEYEDLIARTRRSMVGFEAARQKAQLDRRRSQRKSKLSPRKDSHFSRVEEEAVGDTSVAEELMEDVQVDYEAVFRSRPRIATSPGPSPGKKQDEE